MLVGFGSTFARDRLHNREAQEQAIHLAASRRVSFRGSESRKLPLDEPVALPPKHRVVASDSVKRKSPAVSMDLFGIDSSDVPVTKRRSLAFVRCEDLGKGRIRRVC